MSLTVIRVVKMQEKEMGSRHSLAREYRRLKSLPAGFVRSQEAQSGRGDDMRLYLPDLQSKAFFSSRKLEKTKVLFALYRQK